MSTGIITRPVVSISEILIHKMFVFYLNANGEFNATKRVPCIPLCKLIKSILSIYTVGVTSDLSTLFRLSNCNSSQKSYDVGKRKL